MDLSNRESFRNVFDANPDPIVISRVADGKIILVNREFERASGYAKDEALGRTSTELRLWPDPKERERCAEILQTRGEMRNVDMTLRMKDGSRRPYLLSGAAVWFHDEACNMTVARDVSELRKIEAALIAARNVAESASQAKSEFLSSMSHEIRTPMNAILGMAELLVDTPLDAQQQKYVKLMRNNGNALLELINDILDLARVERGLLHLERTDIDLDRTIEGVLDTFEVRASEKQLRLIAKTADGLTLRRIGDPLRLRQILVNLVGNAIKFTERGSVTVTVQAAPEAGEFVQFAVTDTGIGIPADKIAAIFSSFTQADSSTARRYGGSGLGLAIVVRLVELMEGRIWVESQQGVGSTFYFTTRLAIQPVPKVEPPPAELTVAVTPQASAGVANGDGRARPLSILIVDDSMDNRFLLKAFFKSLPCALDEAQNGLQAVEMVATRRYDLVLMDMRMPVMDGYTATRQIRERERQQAGPAVPIIALTASALQEEVRECLDAGCNFHLAKPIRKTILLEAVARATAPAFESAVVEPG
jgi:PAS domain S-box-containing protein